MRWIVLAEVRSTSEILGLAFSPPACSGVGLSSEWFQGALHFGEEGEDQKLLTCALPGAPSGDQ